MPRYAGVAESERKEFERIVKNNGIAFANRWLAAKRAKSARRGPPASRNAGAVVARRARAPRIGFSEKFGGVSAAIDACCTRWADLLADPFGSNDLCGLPTGSTQTSQKVKVWIKTSLTTGSTPKAGGFSFAPLLMAVSDPTVSPLTTSNSSYATLLVPTPGDTGTDDHDSNAPFTESELGTADGQVMFRVALAAVRVTSATTKLNEGASYMAMTHPNHSTLAGYSAAKIMAFDDTHNLVMANGKPNTLVWIPRAYTSEVEYTASMTTSRSVGGIVVDPSSTTTKCNVEAVAIIEYIGDPARGKTDSMSSSQGDQFLDTAHRVYKAGVSVVNGVARGYQVARDFHDHLVRNGYIQSPIPLRQRHIEL